MADLPLPEAQQAEPCYEELNTNWEAAVQEAKKAGKEPKLMKVGGAAGWRRRAAAPSARKRYNLCCCLRQLLRRKTHQHPAWLHESGVCCSAFVLAVGNVPCAQPLQHAPSSAAAAPPGPHLPQVLWKTYGKDIVLAGIFKLMWSVFVILGGESLPPCWLAWAGPDCTLVAFT